MVKLEEARGISLDDKGLLADVKQTVRQFLPDADVYLYGSVARGTQEADSDYDFLVVTESKLGSKDEETIWDAVFEIEMAREAALSVQFCSHEDWRRHKGMPFYAEVRRDGIAL